MRMNVFLSRANAVQAVNMLEEEDEGVKKELKKKGVISYLDLE
jgi:hypothetical protein